MLYLTHLWSLNDLCRFIPRNICFWLVSQKAHRYDKLAEFSSCTSWLEALLYTCTFKIFLSLLMFIIYQLKGHAASDCIMFTVVSLLCSSPNSRVSFSSQCQLTRSVFIAHLCRLHLVSLLCLFIMCNLCVSVSVRVVLVVKVEK